MRTFLLGPAEGGEEGGGLDSSDDEVEFDEEDLMALKRRSVVQMEANLMEDCDTSYIEPRSITVAESGHGSAQAVEKLLMERLLLRKEMKLRSMQERLLEQSERLDTVETRLKEVERLPGFRSFLWVATAAENAGHLSTQGAAGAAQAAVRAGKVLQGLLVLLVCRLPLCLLHLLPPGVTIALANLAHQLSSLLAQRAENFSNECMEREEERGDRGKVRRSRR